MRGFLEPALRTRPTDTQRGFAALSRHRRAKLAKAANTDLVKASQWARGDGVLAELDRALEGVVAAHLAKRR